jgi:hypothetical protein
VVAGIVYSGWCTVAGKVAASIKKKKIWQFDVFVVEMLLCGPLLIM